ncbi:MAG: GNAT family N-acetyltransferase [Clostridia bacterium]|nr:GNAT family N-acetyltransferase [Clostridia bacterium]
MKIDNIIETPRLMIRSWNKKDRDFTLSLWCDEENGQYMSDPAYKNIDEKYLTCVDEMEDDPDGYFMTAELKETGERVGTCCAFPENENYDIGYCIAKKHWREGLGTELIGALIRWIRGKGGSSVTGEVADENKASAALLRKFGFTEYKKSRFKKWGEDRYFDSHFFRLGLKYGEVYRDERYVLGQDDGGTFIEIEGEKYKLTSHPYEPCLYITDKNGALTAIRNAFDPSCVLQAFSDGLTITSITGMEYDAKDLCRMVEYAAGMGNVQIDEAEKVFGGRAKKKDSERAETARENGTEKGAVNEKEEAAAGEGSLREEDGRVIDDDPFFALIARYPDIEIDYCLVKNGHNPAGYSAHWQALLRASRKLFTDEDGETIWHFDAGRADAKQIGADELFAPVENSGKLNYRTAFLEPPHTNNYTDADFDIVNAALFPGGTDELEVYEWTTDWTEYFDDGREWWGALCLTIYDKKLDRFAVIMASATD